MTILQPIEGTDHRYAYRPVDNKTGDVVGPEVFGWCDSLGEAADMAHEGYPDAPLTDLCGHEVDREELGR